MEDSPSSSRAAAAYAALQAQQYFYVPSRKLYREYYPFDASADQPIGYLWSFEEAARAVLYLYGAPNGASSYARVLEQLFASRELYWDGGGRRRGYRSFPFNGDRYYDDNCWTASNLLQHYLLTSNNKALDRARAVWSYVQSGWTTNLPDSGGIRWVDSRSNGDRATNSTAGWAKLGAQLYEVTGRAMSEYLDTAVQAYAWLRRHLREDEGLYANAMRADGRLDTKLWIYNQGIVIGAAVLLNRVTGDAQYLSEAVALADATLAAFGADAYYSGADGAYSGRAVFNAIFFRNLLMLYAVTGTPVYLEKLQIYADTVWNDARVHDGSGLFHLNGERRYSLLDQSAMVQVYALLTWTPQTYVQLT